MRSFWTNILRQLKVTDASGWVLMFPVEIFHELNAGDLLKCKNAPMLRSRRNQNVEVDFLFSMFDVGPGCTNYWTWVDGGFGVIVFSR